MTSLSRYVLPVVFQATLCLVGCKKAETVPKWKLLAVERAEDYRSTINPRPASIAARQKYEEVAKLSSLDNSHEEIIYAGLLFSSKGDSHMIHINYFADDWAEFGFLELPDGSLTFPMQHDVTDSSGLQAGWLIRGSTASLRPKEKEKLSKIMETSSVELVLRTKANPAGIRLVLGQSTRYNDSPQYMQPRFLKPKS